MFNVNTLVSEIMSNFLYNKQLFNMLSSPDIKSEFDIQLQDNWKKKMSEGAFRYTLDDLQTKHLDGKFKFILQLNIKRATLRRRPIKVTDIIMDMDLDEFNFKKVPPKEIIFLMGKNYSDDLCLVDDFKHTLLLNASPLEFGHSLLVPYIEDNLPQVLNFKALEVAVEVMLLSSSRYFRMAFNSLGGYASVNHLHFHAYFLDEKLFLESAPVQQYMGRCCILKNYPAECFVFEIVTLEDVVEVLKSVMILVEYLQLKKIAHNVFLTRAVELCDIDLSRIDNTLHRIRIYVWARESRFGTKDTLSFNPAVCELAGHIILKDTESFDNIEEEEIVQILYNVCHETYISILSDVKELYK